MVAMSVISTTSSAVFACHSAACAPPSAGGTGGSIAGKGPGGGGGGRGGRSAGKGGPSSPVIKSGGGASGSINRVDAAERMYGTGSKQHKAAIAKYGASDSKGKASGSPAGKVEKNPPANLYKGLSKKESKSVDDAIEAVKANKPVRLKSAAEASTLVSELGKQILSGKAPEKINLCNVSVPGTNLYCGASKDIPRTKMPQLSGVPKEGTEADKWPKDSKGKVDGTNEFIKHLEDSGVKVTLKEVKASSLKASQVELDTKKVSGMVNDDTFDPAGEPIFVSKDGYVIDGHHRWAAQITRDLRDGKTGDLPLNVRVVDLTIDEALQMANDFSDKVGIPQAGM